MRSDGIRSALPILRDLLRYLSPPPVLPDLFPDQAGHARLLVGHRNDPAFRLLAGDFEQQLGPDRFLELVAVLDRHHERAGTADRAAFAIPIEIVDTHGVFKDYRRKFDFIETRWNCSSTAISRIPLSVETNRSSAPPICPGWRSNETGRRNISRRRLSRSVIR